MAFSYHKQETEYSCGAAAMRIALSALGIEKTELELIKLLHTKPDCGTKFADIIILIKKLKLNYFSDNQASILNLKNLLKDDYSVIVYYFNKQEKCPHYSVVKKIDDKNIYFLDPWFGQNFKYSLSYFKNVWKDRKKLDKTAKYFIAIKIK